MLKSFSVLLLMDLQEKTSNAEVLAAYFFQNLKQRPLILYLSTSLPLNCKERVYTCKQKTGKHLAVQFASAKVKQISPLSRTKTL